MEAGNEHAPAPLDQAAADVMAQTHAPACNANHSGSTTAGNGARNTEAPLHMHSLLRQPSPEEVLSTRREPVSAETRAQAEAIVNNVRLGGDIQVGLLYCTLPARTCMRV